MRPCSSSPTGCTATSMPRSGISIRLGAGGTTGWLSSRAADLRGTAGTAGTGVGGAATSGVSVTTAGGLAALVSDAPRHAHSAESTAAAATRDPNTLVAAMIRTGEVSAGPLPGVADGARRRRGRRPRGWRQRPPPSAPGIRRVGRREARHACRHAVGRRVESADGLHGKGEVVILQAPPRVRRSCSRPRRRRRRPAR